MDSFAAEGYIQARKLAKSHYENFPVVSVFIKKTLRNDVAIVYWFARTADDIADEGNNSPDEKVNLLNKFESDFIRTISGNPKNPLEAALLHTINTHSLSTKDFLNLLSAFKQDITVNRYESMDLLLDYCSRSANPVGRIILDLHGIKVENLKLLSDKICTALQLTNFWQDVSVDFLKNRIYVPKLELLRFGVFSDDISSTIDTATFKECIKYLCFYTNNMFKEGQKLVRQLPQPLRYEIAWTVNGGKNILEKIRKIDYNVFRERVTLSKLDYLGLAVLSLLNE